jgi:predicted permease
MIGNYFKTSFRSLQRNKTYTLVNSLGLAVGIAACLLIFLVVQYQTSYDDFHSYKKSIYRVITTFHTQDGASYSGGVAFPVSKGLRADFPAIRQVASIFKNGGQITIDDGNGQPKKLQEENFFYAEPSFFEMFDFGFLSGDARSALKQPNSAILTQETAEKFFGDWRSAIGKTIKYQNKNSYKVTGILKNVPVNTDFPLSIIVPFSSLDQTDLKSNLDDWVSTFSDACVFVILPTDFPVARFNSELKTFAKKHKPAAYANDAYQAQALGEMHFDNRVSMFNEHTFTHSLVDALSLIGLFLVIIACVNFINLATAQAVNRSKEIGVRKVLGSNRYQLAIQFLVETGCIVVLAIIAGYGMARLALPYLNNLLEVQMTMNFGSNPGLIWFMLLLAFAVTLLAGIYPALILSGFNPVTALKNKVTSRMAGGISLRRGLVILQFTIAHVLIIGMLIVVSQMNYFRKASLGFDKDAVINIPLINDSAHLGKLDYLKAQFLENPDIKDLSFSFATPSAEGNWNSDFNFDHASKNTDFNANLKWADPEFFKLYNLEFVAGHAYRASDSVREFVVNETLLKKLGIRNPKEAIGKQINFWNGGKVANIVGVIRDFNTYSLRRPVAPVVLSTWKDVYQTISLKIRPGTEKTVLPFVEKVWTANFPDYYYHYSFLDETIGRFYKHEDHLSQLYKIFAGIAIFISCLGLFGLVSFMAAQRTKEIGVRKVLGASVANIVYLLSKEFTVLILIAFAISIPIGYYIMRDWLDQYSYRITIHASVFLLAILGSILVAWIAVGHRAILAAMANPTKAIRTE